MSGPNGHLRNEMGSIMLKLHYTSNVCRDIVKHFSKKPSWIKTRCECPVKVVRCMASLNVICYILIHTLKVKHYCAARGRVPCELLSVYVMWIARCLSLQRGSHACRLWELAYTATYQFPLILSYLIIISKDVAYLASKFVHEVLGHPVCLHKKQRCVYFPSIVLDN